VIAFVIDTSAAIEIAREPAMTSVLPPDVELYAPELIDLEFASVLRRLVRRGELGAESASAYIADWAANDLIRCSHTPLLSRIWELRDALTTYDASFVALAEVLGIPLATTDHRLARTADQHCEVILIGRD
jgi:predicted nucleic acid-binding protein